MSTLNLKDVARGYTPRSLEELNTIAEQHDCTFIPEGSNEITIDIDCDPNAPVVDIFAEFDSRLSFVNNLFDNGEDPFLTQVKVWRSRHHGVHFILRHKKEHQLDLPLRCAIALALGSDYKREMLALFHGLTGIDTNIGLFKPKERE